MPLLFSFGDGGKAWLIKEETFIKASDPTTVVLLICARYTIYISSNLLFVDDLRQSLYHFQDKENLRCIKSFFVGRERPPRLSPEGFFFRQREKEAANATEALLLLQGPKSTTEEE